MQETKKCIICGKQFENKRKNTVCCSEECKILRDKELHRELNQAYRKEKKQKESKPKSTLEKSLKELKEYNKKHKTNFSYGQYKAVLFMESRK